MIFDFHTHIFPDKIAEKTVCILKKNIMDVQGGEEPTTYTDATVLSLKKSMEENNIDYSLVLPIATNTKQSETINSFAASINGKDGIFSLGSVHPMQENVENEIERIKSLGLKGIKLHPEYQNIYINSPECINVLKKCSELNLIVISHTGADIGMKPPVKCTPQMLYDALQRVPDITFVAAHMGGWDMWDDVKKYLLGTSVYFDTAFSYEFMGQEKFYEFINAHKNIVFGTDSPWGCQKTDVNDIKNLKLDSERFNEIMYKNAWDLLS